MVSKEKAFFFSPSLESDSVIDEYDGVIKLGQVLIIKQCGARSDQYDCFSLVSVFESS